MLVLLLLACQPAKDARDADVPRDDTGAAHDDSGDDTAPYVPGPCDTGVPGELRSLDEADACVIGMDGQDVGNAVALVARAEGPAAIAVAAEGAAEVCVFAGAPAAGMWPIDEVESCWASANGTDGTGWALAAAPDLDGDGDGDLLVGAPFDSEGGPGAGALHVLHAPATPGRHAIGEADATYYGEEGDWAGAGASFGGDVDGDGAEDLLVGAYLIGEEDRNDGGRVYVVQGPVLDGEHRLADAETTISGAGYSVDAPGYGDGEPGDGIGGSLAGGADVDGDGLADVAIGAPGHDTWGPGAVGVFLSPLPTGALEFADADQLYVGDSPELYVGQTVASAGDLDQDGLADLLVGTRSGQITWVVSGPGTSGVSSIADAPLSFFGPSDPRDSFGHVAASAGDANADGWPDVVVGAPNNSVVATGTGAVFLGYGPFSVGAIELGVTDGLEAAWYGERAFDLAGSAVAGGQDADGDGTDDVLVGAQYYGEPSNGIAGEAYLLLSR